MDNSFDIVEKDGMMEIRIPIDKIVNGNENDFIFFLGFMEHVKNKVLAILKLKRVIAKKSGVITPKIV